MKHRLLSIAISVLSLSAVVAQNDTQASPDLSDHFFMPADSLYLERVVYEVFNMDNPPVYPGGEKELFKYLAENIKYPAANRENDLISMVAITFIVEPDGSISNAKVVRNDGAFAQSVLKVVEQMPYWSPGIKDGQAVAVRFWLPVRVYLR